MLAFVTSPARLGSRGAAQTILSDLEDDGYLRKTKIGRRNTYAVNPRGTFRHPEEAGQRIGDLLNLFEK